MRVALICETFLPSVNGVTTTLCRVLEHLAADGHEVLLLAPHDAPTSYAGHQVIPLNSLPLPFYQEVKVTPPQLGITAHLRRFKPDLVHVVGPAVLGAGATAVVRGLGLPLLSSYHTNFGTYSTHYGVGFLKTPVDAYLRWIHNRSLLTLCPSLATMRELRAQGFRRLRVWGRGVDTTRFHPDHRSTAWRQSAGVQPGETALVYVGRLAKEKRVDLLADTLRQLQGARLIVVGDGPARSDLERRMDGLPVHFTGYLQGHDLATAYASSDVFVFPSDTETFGQVVQEAMSSGLAVVGARGGGTLDLVRDGQTGALCVPGSATDMAAQLRPLIAAPDQRLAMGHAARTTAEGRSWPVVVNELLHHYQRTMLRAPRQRLAPSMR